MSSACKTDTKFYDTDTKDMWGHEWWDMASRRCLPDRHVLFVCGPRSVDVGRALKTTRIKPWQLVACDVVKENVDRVRKRGIAGRVEPIEKTVEGWPSMQPLGFVSADMTWAPGKNYIRLIQSLAQSRGVDEDTIVGFNVSAGNLHPKFSEYLKAVQFKGIADDVLEAVGVSRGDRGYMMWELCVSMIYEGLCKLGRVPRDNQWATSRFIADAWHEMNPKFFRRYRRHKNAMPMDSVQFRWALPAYAFSDPRYEIDNTQSIRGTIAHATKMKERWSWNERRQKWLLS